MICLTVLLALAFKVSEDNGIIDRQVCFLGDLVIALYQSFECFLVEMC
jgi:hypothetical protein